MTQEAISRAFRDAVLGDGTLPAPAEPSANPTEHVIAAYSTAACGGAGESVFDIAVRVYLGHYPKTARSAAARIVADIISHRW